MTPALSHSHHLGREVVGICVVFVCHDGEGNIVMAKRGSAARDEPGRWDVGGGAVEFGQTALQAVSTEVAEEYGSPCEETVFMGYRDVLRTSAGIKTHWVSLDFLVRVDSSAVHNAEPHKLDAVAWFRLTHMPSPIHTGIPQILRLYRADLAEANITADAGILSRPPTP